MQEQKAKWTFEQGGFSKALIACAPMGTGYHLHLIRFGRHTAFPLTNERDFPWLCIQPIGMRPWVTFHSRDPR